MEDPQEPGPSSKPNRPCTISINKYSDDNPICYKYRRAVERSFKRDCEKFLLEFDECRSFSLKVFVELWNKSKFAAIFRDEEFTVKEFQHCAEPLFFSIRKFIKHSRSSYIKVGALYLLYAIYTKQERSASSICKIVLTMAEWTHLLNFVQRMYEFGEPDVEFIFTKLYMEEAFEFTVTDRCMGLEHRFEKQQIELENDILLTQLANPIRSIEKFVLTEENNYGLNDLEEVDKRYEKSVKNLEQRFGKKIKVQSANTFYEKLKAELQKLKEIQLPNLSDQESTEDELEKSDTDNDARVVRVEIETETEDST